MLFQPGDHVRILAKSRARVRWKMPVALAIAVTARK
jgi:hypothetical protein